MNELTIRELRNTLNSIKVLLERISSGEVIYSIDSKRLEEHLQGLGRLNTLVDKFEKEILKYKNERQ